MSHVNVSEFEKQFQEVSDKLTQAAKLLKEANKLSNKYGMGDLGEYDRSFSMPEGLSDREQDILLDTFDNQKYILLDVLQECGWRTSSLSC